MTQLITRNDALLNIVSFQARTTEAAEAELVANGWSHADALKQIDMAIRIGALQKVETASPARGRVRAQTQEEQAAGGGTNEGNQ